MGKISTRKRILIGAIAACFLAGTSAFVLLHHKSFSHITTSGYDVSGVWYSTSDEEVLLLEEDGKYESTMLFPFGTYTVTKEDQICLTDQYGDNIYLDIAEAGEESILSTTIGKMPYTYSRYAPDLSAAFEDTEKDSSDRNSSTPEQVHEQVAMDALILGAIQDILQTESWTGDDKSTLTFSDSSFVYEANGKSEVFQYEMRKYTSEPNLYTVIMQQADANHNTEEKTIRIEIGENDSYTLTGLNAASYHKTAHIIFSEN